MPIYEYHCEPCDHTFETLIRSASETPHCPRCGGEQLAKQLSVPAAAQTGGKAGSLPVCEAPSSPFGCGGGQCRSGMCAME